MKTQRSMRDYLTAGLKAEQTVPEAKVDDDRKPPIAPADQYWDRYARLPLGLLKCLASGRRGQQGRNPGPALAVIMAIAANEMLDRNFCVLDQNLLTRRVGSVQRRYVRSCIARLIQMNWLRRIRQPDPQRTFQLLDARGQPMHREQWVGMWQNWASAAHGNVPGANRGILRIWYGTYDLTPAEKVVYGYLRLKSDDARHLVTVGKYVMADELGMDRQTVAKLIKALVGKGYVTVCETPGPRQPDHILVHELEADEYRKRMVPSGERQGEA